VAIQRLEPEIKKTYLNSQILKLIHDYSIDRQDKIKVLEMLNKWPTVCGVWLWKWSPWLIFDKIIKFKWDFDRH